jgi:2-dehydro-3-deoxygluconokinase
MKVASIGECMIELNNAGGLFSRAFGGDTLNTALYLARLGIDTSYVTALGDDAISDEMIAAWRAESIDTSYVLRAPGRLPGLYMIERDANGERSFLYWRDRAPAREVFDRLDDAAIAKLAAFDLIYFSGITLSLYSDAGREKLFKLLSSVRSHGGRVAFDGNYRPRGWKDAATARDIFTQALAYVDIALPSFEDEQNLFGDKDADSCAARMRHSGVSEVIVKIGRQGCVAYHDATRKEIAPGVVVKPVDTTAAGDSFNAGYLAARAKGASAADAARAGHRLACAVIQYPGAIIPKDKMPSIAKDAT